MAFKPETHLTNLSRDQNKPRWYLETKWRLMWLREEHPDWRVDTDLLQADPFPVVKARVINENGELIATGHGSAQPKPGSVYAGREIEKAETAAIGRALAHAGYGTQYVGEDEEDPVDAPVERKNGNSVQRTDRSHVSTGATTRTKWTTQGVHDFLDFWQGRGVSVETLKLILRANTSWEDMKANYPTVEAAQAEVEHWLLQQPSDLAEANVKF